jgi:hypothetical protein
MPNTISGRFTQIWMTQTFLHLNFLHRNILVGTWRPIRETKPCFVVQPDESGRLVSECRYRSVNELWLPPHLALVAKSPLEGFQQREVPFGNGMAWVVRTGRFQGEVTHKQHSKIQYMILNNSTYAIGTFCGGIGIS